MSIQILSQHIEAVSRKFDDEFGGWSFDVLVFWNDVDRIEQETGKSLADAYDLVASRYSFIKSYQELMDEHEKDTP